VDIKPRPNHQRYLEILRRMTPDERLQKSFELTDYSRQLLKDGLRQRHPNISEEELHRLFLKALDRCHNRNY
jgi:hypothetical protein